MYRRHSIAPQAGGSLDIQVYLFQVRRQGDCENKYMFFLMENTATTPPPCPSEGVFVMALTETSVSAKFE